MAVTTKPMSTSITHATSDALTLTPDAMIGLETVTAKPKACIDMSNVATWTNGSGSGDPKDIVLFKFIDAGGTVRYVIYDDSAVALALAT